jgi:hypothetical protein
LKPIFGVRLFVTLDLISFPIPFNSDTNAQHYATLSLNDPGLASWAGRSSTV